MTQKMTQDELVALIDREAEQAYGYGDGQLEAERARNENYFFARPIGDLAPPAIDGRSRVVDTTVRDTVLGMEAPLIKTFFGTENVFQFEETKPEDAEQAPLVSDYVNYILRKKNPGYQIGTTWIRDALQVKKGILKVWWDDSAIESKEEYRGQTEVQLAMLLEDPEIELIGQKAYPDEDAAEQLQQATEQLTAQLMQAQAAAAQNPQAAQAVQQLQAQLAQLLQQPVPMLYDVVCKRVKDGGRLCIENVPPWEFLNSKKCGSNLNQTPWCGHRFKRTVGYLKSQGYDVPDDLASGDDTSEFNADRIDADQFPNDLYNQESYTDGNDPSQREIWLLESYQQVDWDGDGIPEWRKVLKAGKHVFSNEECDGHPFVALDSVPLPHQFYGTCPADLAIEAQRVRTSLMRAALDNVYLQVNGRYFAQEGQVNLDDLLNSRPGGVVRVKNPGAVGRLDQGVGDIGTTLQMLEWYEQAAEESTGWSRQSMGGNGMQLQQTATQANIVTNRADSRVELISRTMAEGGFTDLGNKILKLVTQYQKKAEQIKLNGKWVNIDPRAWTNQFQLSINVGLGTGNKDQLISHLAVMSQKQMEGLPLGITTPQNVYNADVKLAEALGFKDASKFFTDPESMPPRPPAPDPNLAKLQFDQQRFAQELQFKQQNAELDRQAQLAEAQIKAEAQMRVDQNRQQLEAEQQELRAQRQAQLDAQQAEYAHQQEMARIELERQKIASAEYQAQLQAEVERYKADISEQGKIVAAQISAGQQGDPTLTAAEDAANRGAAT
jgi:hypothetical protein